MMEREPASNPVLLQVLETVNTYSKQKYVVYYEVPGQADHYRNLDELREVLLTNRILKFKVLDLESPDS